MSDPQGALLGNAVGYVDIDATGVSRGLNQAKGEFNNFITSAGGMFKGLGDSLTSFGSQMTMFTAPLTIFAGAGLKAASDFDSVLTEIQARTGLGVQEMQRIKDEALRMGAETIFSGQQSLEAFLNLLTAGLNEQQALATLPAVLNAAAAGSMNLGMAADFTTSIMSQFQLEAKDATQVIDAMAQSSAASPATMQEMGEALNIAGSVARQFGFDVSESNAALAIFAQNGLRGSKAGDNLKSMLTQLAESTTVYADDWAALGTSLYDTSGNMRDFDTVLAEVRVGLERLPVQRQNEIIQHLAGSFGIVGFNALLASDGIAAMQGQMAEQASAAEVAAVMMNTFKAKVDSLMGSVQAFWITVLTPFMNNALKPLIDMMIGAVNAVTTWAAANEPLVQSIVTMVAGFLALGPTAWGIGRAFQFVGFILKSLGVGLGFLMSPLGLFIAAAGLLAYLFREQLSGLITKIGEEFAFFGRIFAEDGLLHTLQIFFTTFEDGSSYMGHILENVFGMTGDSADALGRTINDVVGYISNIIGGFVTTAKAAFAIFFGLLENGVPIFDALQAAIGATFGTWDWAQIGTDILNGLGAGLSAIGTWVNDNLITPLMNTFNSIDWGMVGDLILQGIGLAISLYSGWINFVTDNILSPLFENAKNALGGIDWRQLGEDIIGFIFDPSSSSAGGVDWGAVFGGWMNAIVNFGTSVFDFMGWAFQNVISPLWQGYIDGLSQVDWGAVGTTLMNLLGMALNALWAAGTWVWDNFLSPMLSAIGTALSTVDWMQLGLDLLNALGQGLLMLWAAGTWVYDNLLMPMLDNAKLAIEQIDWSQVGADIVNAIGAALKATFDFMAWIIDSLFNPMTENADAATGQIDWAGVGNSIMGAISGAIIGIFNFVKWLKDTIFGPLLDGAGEAINNLNWTSIGHNLFSAIANALPDIAKWVQDNIITPISNALAGFDPIGMITGSSGAHVGNAGAFAAHMANSPNVSSSGGLGTGFASGINFVPQNMLAMIHQGEAIIPANMNPFNPNAERGAGGGDIHIQQIIVPGVRNYNEGVEAGRGIGDGIRETLRQKGGGRG